MSLHEISKTGAVISCSSLKAPNISVSNVTFSTDKGLLLKPSEDLLEDEDYSTLIIWSVEE